MHHTDGFQSEGKDREGKENVFLVDVPMEKSHYVFILPSYFPQASCLDSISQNISRSNQSFFVPALTSLLFIYVTSCSQR